jgi:homoserine kinase type II
MAVFTPVTGDQLRLWLRDFGIGELVRFEGIASGIENSNFYLDTTEGRFVLTIFERLGASQLPFYIALMSHLAERGIACPRPIADREGKKLKVLQGKPASIVTCLPGQAQNQPNTHQCAAVGEHLAAMHLAAREFSGDQPNLRGLAWWHQVIPQLEAHVDPAQWRMLVDELQEQDCFHSSPRYALLPRSAVHADLFRDNVLFDCDQLGGVIDFYFAGVDTWVFDLAVACNDWCIDDATGQWDPGRLQALLGGYCTLRQPTAPEAQCWGEALRAAGLRFWVSRLFDLHLPRDAALLVPKDPQHFERVLRARRELPQDHGLEEALHCAHNNVVRRALKRA